MMKQRQKRDVNYKKFDKHSSSDEETELFVRKKSSPKREMPSVEKVVEEGDTLQSLAICYHCTIEDLKRLNNIHKENEIFAKRTIKVPYYPITEALVGVHQSGSSSPFESLPASTTASDSVILKSNISTTLINLSNKEEEEVKNIIFNSHIIQKSPEVVYTEDLEHEEDNEEIHLLPQVRTELTPDPTVAKLSCSGVDGDISLKALIFCIVVVIFAVPMIYVFYIAEHPEQYHHHHQNHTR